MVDVETSPTERLPRLGLVEQCGVSFAMQLSNWRWATVQIFITCLIVPCLAIAGMGIFARPMGEAVLSYLLVGNVVISILFGMLSNVATNFSFMKVSGMLTYFQALPVRMFAVTLGTCAAFAVLASPAVLGTLVFGSLYLNVPWHPSIHLVWVVPLACLPMGCIGGLIGILARNFNESSALNFLATTAMTVIGPVLVYPSLLPGWLVSVSMINPAVHAARLFRWSLLGIDLPLPDVLVSLSYLLLLAAVGPWLISSRLVAKTG